jgi:hypothetical protein
LSARSLFRRDWLPFHEFRLQALLFALGLLSHFPPLVATDLQVADPHPLSLQHLFRLAALPLPRGSSPL